MKSVSVKLTGAIIVQVGDTTSYHLALLKDYKSHNTSQSVFMKAMMVLDAKVYGYSKFKIEDTIALSNTKEVYFSINTTSSNTIKKGLLNTDDPCDIIEIWYNPDGDHCNCNGDEYNTGDWYYADEENCFSSTPQPVLWYFLGGSGELPDKYYTLPDFGEGNGGGGSNDPPYTPIPITETQKKELSDGRIKSQSNTGILFGKYTRCD